MNRLVKYESRRQHQIRELKDRLEELNAKWVFVRAIVDGRLKIMNEEDSVVLAGLLKLGLPPRSDRENSQTLGAFEYLLRMRVDRIKKSAVLEAEEEVKAITAQLKHFEDTNARALWKDDLVAFQEAWQRHKQTMMGVLTASAEAGAVAQPKKKTVVRRKT